MAAFITALGRRAVTREAGSIDGVLRQESRYCDRSEMADFRSATISANGMACSGSGKVDANLQRCGKIANLVFSDLSFAAAVRRTADSVAPFRTAKRGDLAGVQVVHRYHHRRAGRSPLRPTIRGRPGSIAIEITSAVVRPARLWPVRPSRPVL